jgi:acyl-ACP thioesterase
MYTYEKKILFSDIDSNSNMSLESILDAMQDCVNINSESIGKGIEYMHRTGRAWFAISWNIEIKRYPKMFENVVVKTWPYSFSSSMGYRNVIITDEAGQDILCADSIWSLVDTKTGLPTKILEEDYTGYELEEKYPMEALGRKIKLPKQKDGETGFVKTGEHIVTKSDLDFNGHMTNGRYIKYADDLVPIGTAINKVRVEYKSQSKFGEVLDIEKYVHEDRWLVRFLGQQSQDVKAVVEVVIDGTHANCS